MNRGRVNGIATGALLACLAVRHGALADDRHGTWVLMSRHGECEPMASLRREVPALPEITEPAALVGFLESQGHFVASRSLPGSAGRAYQVDVADLSLNLVLVRESLCAAR
ncbi:MAG: hypothetical protein H6977_13120 [Gammaproteobacteria bacterium]|nr:hypothetical protein [Gammaproteobacteria bacterium]